MTGPTPYRSLPTEQTVLREPPRDIPEWASVDLCIVGGNAAGLGAAVEAHRAGMRHILLIEQYGFCGGANAAGMSGPLCGLFASGTAQPQLLTEGSSCEFYDRLRAPGGVADPFPFSKTYLAVHEPLGRAGTAVRVARLAVLVVFDDVVAGDKSWHQGASCHEEAPRALG